MNIILSFNLYILDYNNFFFFIQSLYAKFIFRHHRHTDNDLSEFLTLPMKYVFLLM